MQWRGDDAAYHYEPKWYSLLGIILWRNLFTDGRRPVKAFLGASEIPHGYNWNSAVAY